MGTGSFLGVKSGQGVTMTTHPLLVPWSWKGTAIPLLPLWAVRPVQSLSACTGVTFTLTQCLYKGDLYLFFFFYQKRPNRFWTPPASLRPSMQRLPRLRRLSREANYVCPSGAEVQNGCSWPAHPHMDNSTLLFFTTGFQRHCKAICIGGQERARTLPKALTGSVYYLGSLYAARVLRSNVRPPEKFWHKKDLVPNNLRHTHEPKCQYGLTSCPPLCAAAKAYTFS